jgi:hypothetical protein
VAVPGRIRCNQCGQVWPGSSRFCGRCGQVLRIVHEHHALDADAEEYTRSRRRIVRLLVFILATLVLIAVLTMGGDPEPPPDDPPLDPQIEM